MSVAMEDMSAYARGLVERFGLEAHPEGGWYRRDWQAKHIEARSGRPLASLIYFLLPEGDASAWHKVDADEIWLWHGPAPVTLELGGDGERPAEPADITRITLGPVDGEGESVGHTVVPEGVWQRTVPGHGDALVSCVVSPGFTFDGFELADEEAGETR